MSLLFQPIITQIRLALSLLYVLYYHFVLPLTYFTNLNSGTRLSDTRGQGSAELYGGPSHVQTGAAAATEDGDGSDAEEEDGENDGGRCGGWWWFLLYVLETSFPTHPAWEQSHDNWVCQRREENVNDPLHRAVSRKAKKRRI